MSPTATISSDSLGELEGVARQIRGNLCEMSHKAGTPHLGSSLSCGDILVAVYWGTLAIDPEEPQNPDALIMAVNKYSRFMTRLQMNGHGNIEDKTSVEITKTKTTVY